MAETSGIPIHYVCTMGEAKELCRSYAEAWVSNCGCREGNPAGCRQSRSDVCLMFSADQNASGSGKRRIGRDELDELLREAEKTKLVARPFRTEDRKGTDGVCFCCSDCCGYFLNPEEVCDKGRHIETTDLDTCLHCGICVEACHFGARSMQQAKLAVDRTKCYGCGRCVAPCPQECIAMEKR